MLYDECMETKTCTRCAVEKPVEEYYRDARYDSGRVSECKQCARERGAQRYRARMAADPEGYRQERREWAQRNADKMKEYRTKWLEENGHRHRRSVRKHHLLTKYGITLDQYEAMLDEQDGRCAACGSTETGWKWDVFHVDHNHTTGAVRALLCAGCNMALGAVNDSLSRMLTLVDYLRQHGEVSE